MAFPRALSLVRGTNALQTDIAARAEAPAPPMVREASALLDAIRASIGVRISKSTALKVPAFARAYELYTGTISCFPLVDRVGDDRVPNSLLDTPDPSLPYSSWMARLVGDVVCHDSAWLLVAAVDWRGFPSRLVYVPAEKVSTIAVDPITEQPVGSVLVGGVERRLSDPATAYTQTGTVIHIPGDGSGGWLTTGVDAITTAASLEAAVLRSAESPSPSVILKNTGADLPPDQVDALLEAWETARAQRSTAYLNATIDTHGLTGWSPNDLQLVEARNAAATQIARLANLDPVWVGAGVPGSSLTYTNRQDLYRQLLDLSLMPVMRHITDRLSAWDVTPEGHVTGFDTDTFLRANTTDIVALVTQLLPLGVITEDDARRLLDLGGLA